MAGGFAERLRERIECMRVRPRLQAWLDGALAPPEGQRIAEHVDDCPRCGPLAQTYRALKRRLRGLSAPAEAESVDRLRAFLGELDRDDRADGSTRE